MNESGDISSCIVYFDILLKAVWCSPVHRSQFALDSSRMTKQRRKGRAGGQVCNGVVAAGTGRQTQWDDIAGQEVSLPDPLVELPGLCLPAVLSR